MASCVVLKLPLARTGVKDSIVPPLKPRGSCELNNSNVLKGEASKIINITSCVNMTTTKPYRYIQDQQDIS